MTVSAGVRLRSYTGNGVTTNFAVPFQFFEILIAVDGVTQTSGTHYTITGGNGNTGTVIFTTPPASGKRVDIIGNETIVQSIDLAENDPFPADTIERAFDRLTMIASNHDFRIAGIEDVKADAEASAVAAASSAAAAASSASAAATSAADAHTSENNAEDSEEAAAASADTASSAASSATASAAAAAASFADFDKRYLGPKSSEPSVDNQGQPLAFGALYFSSVTNKMRVWIGSSWQDVSTGGGGGGGGADGEVATLTSLKALNGASLTTGQLVYMMCGSSLGDGKEGWFIYDAGSSATADDIVTVAPADNNGRFVRQEWYSYAELHARWWGLKLNSTADQAANGTAMTNLFAFISAASKAGTVYFPWGVIYVELATALTLTKVRGWRFQGVSDAGVAHGSGTRFYIRGGGMDYFIKYRTVLETIWRDCYFIVQGSGMSGIFDVGAANYYDTDGVTIIDSAAVSSYLNEWNNCTLTADVAGGYSVSVASMFFHSAVTNYIRSCWMTGVNSVLFLGNTLALDVQCIAKGTCAQLVIENTMMDGDIRVRNLDGLSIRGGQLTRQSGVGPGTRAARLLPSVLVAARGIEITDCALGYGGDFGAEFVGVDMHIQGFRVRNCTIGTYSFFARADGNSSDWDISPTWAVPDSAVVGAAGILQIMSTCTGTNINCGSVKDSRVATVVDDLRTTRDFRANILQASRTFDWVSLANGASNQQAVTVTGAAVGDPAMVTMSTDLQGLTCMAWVGTANQVAVRMTNNTGATVDLPSATMTASVFKRSV